MPPWSDFFSGWNPWLFSRKNYFPLIFLSSSTLGVPSRREASNRGLCILRHAGPRRRNTQQVFCIQLLVKKQQRPDMNPPINKQTINFRNFECSFKFYRRRSLNKVCSCFYLNHVTRDSLKKYLLMLLMQNATVRQSGGIPPTHGPDPSQAMYSMSDMHGG